jgi:hypothetical protein
MKRHATPEEIRGWFTGRLPEAWFTEPVDISIDREEITVVGRIPEPTLPEGTTDAERAAAFAGRIRSFREETRGRRIEIALEAEHVLDRKVSWGAQCGERRELFTTLSVPVMTRLRQPERQILDTLVDAGVARSRSHALVWCVKLVGKHADSWLAELRQAMESVERIRNEGPDATQ